MEENSKKSRKLFGKTHTSGILRASDLSDKPHALVKTEQSDLVETQKYLEAVPGSVGGYYATERLLQELYAYHISVGLLPVFLSAAFIFGVGILTTSVTILKAARSNPVNSLRTE